MPPPAVLSKKKGLRKNSKKKKGKLNLIHHCNRKSVLSKKRSKKGSNRRKCSVPVLFYAAKIVEKPKPILGGLDNLTAEARKVIPKFFQNRLLQDSLPVRATNCCNVASEKIDGSFLRFECEW